MIAYDDDESEKSMEYKECFDPWINESKGCDFMSYIVRNSKSIYTIPGIYDEWKKELRLKK